MTFMSPATVLLSLKTPDSYDYQAAETSEVRVQLPVLSPFHVIVTEHLEGGGVCSGSRFEGVAHLGREAVEIGGLARDGHTASTVRKQRRVLAAQLTFSFFFRTPGTMSPTFRLRLPVSVNPVWKLSHRYACLLSNPGSCHVTPS